MNSIIKFHTESFIDALKAFFIELKVPITYWDDKPASAESILEKKFKETNEAHQLIADVYALGVVDESSFKQNENSLFGGKSTSNTLEQVKNHKDYDGLLIFGVTLHQRKDNLPITRSHLAEITRAFNRAFPHTPTTIIFKYNGFISFANSERSSYKQEWREGEKIGKVIIVQNIDVLNTHSGHKRILLELTKPNKANSYKELLNHWNDVLDVSILNKKFFTDLSNWYFWAMENVSFPDDLEKKKEIRNATNLIRLITRVVFIWFIKEKSLVSNNLFNKAFLGTILKDFNQNKQSQNYYNAILQNLFFGTLNQRIEERKFSKEGDINTNKVHFGVKNLFRYADLFNISEDEAMQLFKDVPFLNGGLFDCLDKLNEEGKMVYVDGFSRNKKRQATIPDEIFFGEEREVNLNDVYATKNKKYKVQGLINLLESYKFTVEENTPLEEEVALDPELLGKVFENLLASYNPETQTTARKQTGSFYTPREIVNYMVDESLLEYIKQNCLTKINTIQNATETKNPDADFELRLRNLLSYAEMPNPFDENETKILIEAINNAKILDPACGSGAYPMGILHKMVHLLRKLDPQNIHWRALQRLKAMEETDATFQIGDKEERGKRLAEINDVFENNASDYGRKLYLIENCIYGIDVQPIAVQISKLRFFISLIIDQNKQTTKENFGIRSLPNLETKFVAANTLIGLNKPAQTLLRNPKIELKEVELKELRHKYFTASTRTEKLKYQKQDKNLRQEIASLLEKDGWNTTVANQIVAFDPYDQNISANWFDPEWMFGLATGFDIVVGNPPYVQVSKDIFSANQFPYSQGKDKGKQNLYKVFVEGSYNLLKTNGVATMIVQSSLMCDVSSQYTRELLLTKTTIKEILEFPKKAKNKEGQVFDSVLQGTCIYIITKTIPSANHQFNVSIDNDVTTIPKLKYEQLNQQELIKIYPNGYFIPLVKKYEFKILKKLNKNAEPLNKFIDVISQGDINLTVASDFFSSNLTEVVLLRGKNTHKYNIDYDNEEYIQNNHKSNIVSVNQKTVHFVCQQITGTMDKFRLHFAITAKSKKFIFGNSVNKFNLKNEKYNQFILGILNSKLMDWYFRKTSTNNHVNGYEIEQLPIMIGSDEVISKFELLVDEILSSKKAGTSTVTLEHQIDVMVYHLYGLSFEEAQMIDIQLRQEDF